jgi:hypothetical protein
MSRFVTPLERLRGTAKQRRKAHTWIHVRAIILAKQGDPAVRIARCLGCRVAAAPSGLG